MAKVIKAEDSWLVTTDAGDLIEVFEGTLVGRRKARLFARGMTDGFTTEPETLQKSGKGKKASAKKTKKR